MPDQERLITDVRGIVYIVHVMGNRMWFAPCEYDGETRRAHFPPALQVQLVAARNLSPVERHEQRIRKLIALHTTIQPISQKAMESN